MIRVALAAIVVLSGTAALQPKPKPAAPLKVAPVAYFSAHCTRCHGPSGAFYAEGFTKNKTDEALKKVISEMASGPGGAPLDAEGVVAQAALHRAFDTKAPFLCWTVRDGLKLEGEAVAAEKVSATTAKGSLPVKVEDGHWSLTLGSEKDLATLRITAQTGQAKAVLAPAKSNLSMPAKP